MANDQQAAPVAWLVPMLNGKPRLFTDLGEARAFCGKQNGMVYPQPLIVAPGYPYRAADVLASCAWEEEDPDSMPGTYRSACGELWAFTDGGVAENNVRFCQGCGKPVAVVPRPPEPSDEDDAGANPCEGSNP